jgi:putative thioredoxin
MSTPPLPRNFAGAMDLSALVNRAKQAQAPATPPAPAGTSAYVRDINESEMGQIVELSNTVPVILEIYGQGVTPQMGGLIEKYQGKLLLATLNADHAPQLVQALQIQGVPTVLAIIQGRPAPLFQGQAPEAEITPVLDEVLKVAGQAGVTGVVPGSEHTEHDAPETAEEPPLSPEHQRAFDALSAHDWDGAEAAYRDALGKAPADAEAKAGLAQVGLLKRLASHSADTIREGAAKDPGNLEAQLLVADLDVSGGHLDDGFTRLLGLFSAADADAKEMLRTRLLEYFDMAGPTHPSVIAARARLTSLLY